MFRTQVLLFYLAVTFIELGYSKKNFKVILEREEIPFSDSQYVIINDHSLKKINRTSPYVYNLNMTLLRPWYNNVSYSIKTYEKRSNEYRESIISIHFSICEALEKGNFLLDVARSFSNVPKKCPMVDNLTVTNMYVDENKFPDGFPISKWKFSWDVYLTENRKKIALIELYFQVVPKTPRKGKIN